MHMLDAVADESESHLLQASWARRLWAKWVANVLSDLDNRRVMDKLNLDVVSDNEQVKQLQTADVEMYFGLTVRTAAQRAWMMLSLHDLPPASWKGLFHPAEAESASAWQQLRQDCLCVKKAFDAINSKTHPEHQAAADMVFGLRFRLRVWSEVVACLLRAC